MPMSLESSPLRDPPSGNVPPSMAALHLSRVLSTLPHPPLRTMLLMPSLISNPTPLQLLVSPPGLVPSLRAVTALLYPTSVALAATLSLRLVLIALAPTLIHMLMYSQTSTFNFVKWFIRYNYLYFTGSDRSSSVGHSGVPRRPEQTPR